MSGYNPTTGERTDPVVRDDDGNPVEPHIGISNKEQELEFRIAEAQKSLERLGDKGDPRRFETQVIPEDANPHSPDELGVPARDEVGKGDAVRAERAWEGKSGQAREAAAKKAASAEKKDEGQAKKTAPAPAK